MVVVQFLYKLFQPILFLISPEKLHNIALVFLRLISYLESINIIGLKKTKKGKGDQFLIQRLFGRTIDNPVVLAAGFDKGAEVTDSTTWLNFSFMEVGTFTKLPQKGNPQPRVFRFASKKAIFNRMGFNNPGIAEGINNLCRSNKLHNAFVRPGAGSGVKQGVSPDDRDMAIPVAISIGKSRDTPVEKAAQDYYSILADIERTAKNIDAFKERVVYIAINISSPNTPGLRDLQSVENIGKLIKGIRSRTNFSLVVKLSPDINNEKMFTETVRMALKSGVDGFIVTNTSTDYSLLPKMPTDISAAGGGISGEPLKQKSLSILRRTVEITKGKVPVISSGGVMEPEDVWQRLLCGADLVQIYSGFIFYGPSLVRDSIKYVRNKIIESGFNSLTEFLKHRNKELY